MASDEAKVRVRLDTRQAKGELRGLTKEGSKAAGRVGAGIRRGIGRGLGAIGLGVGIGAGMAALKGPTQGGISALISQTLGATGHQIARGIFGDKLPEAIGRAGALEKLKASRGFMLGLTGKAPGAKAQFDFDATMGTIKALGDQTISADPQFRNEAAQVLSKKLMEAAEAIGKFVQYVRSPSVLGPGGPVDKFIGGNPLLDALMPKKKGLGKGGR